MPQTAEQMRAEQAFVDKAVQKYCDWLNSFDPEGYRIQPEDQSVVPVVRYIAPEYNVIVLRTTIKGEAEAATVTLMFDEDDWQLDHATQSFDGHLSIWWHEGKPYEWGRGSTHG